MGKLAERLEEELNVHYITFHPFGMECQVAESVVMTWIIMIIMVGLAIFLTAGMSVHHITKRQAVAELIVTKLEGIVEGMIGPGGKRYVPYLATVLFYIGLSNIIGVFDLGLFEFRLKPPTKDLNVTAALALMSICLIEYAGIHSRGTVGWLKSFAEPIAVIAPLNVLEIFIRPLSLCMRLFGNVLGAFTIMELLKMACPPVLPAAASLYFDLFDGLIQAYIFVFLTSMFIKEALIEAE